MSVVQLFYILLPELKPLPTFWFFCVTLLNSKGDSATHWKIPLWIFIWANFLSHAVSSTLHVFMVFSIKFMTSCDILYIFNIIIIHSLELFTSTLADGFSLESELQQVSSSLRDSSQYSGRSQ